MLKAELGFGYLEESKLIKNLGGYDAIGEKLSLTGSDSCDFLDLINLIPLSTGFA